jgi:hypothetical protein
MRVALGSVLRMSVVPLAVRACGRPCAPGWVRGLGAVGPSVLGAGEGRFGGHPVEGTRVESADGPLGRLHRR